MKGVYNYGIIIALVAAFMLGATAVAAQEDTVWNRQKARAWFKQAVWLNARLPRQLHYDTFGRVLDEDAGGDTAGNRPHTAIALKPHASINIEAFALQYNTDKAWWDEAFAYLQETDLASLTPGKFSIDGDNVMVTITEGTPRKLDTTKWESHLLYDDIHYVISGKEKIGVTRLANVKQAGTYNPVRDLIYYTGNKGIYYEAVPGTFYVFFPGDAHRPNLQLNNQQDKKIVIKVRRSKH